MRREEEEEEEGPSPGWKKKVTPELRELAGHYQGCVEMGEQLKSLPRERWKEVLGEPDPETDKRCQERLDQLLSNASPEQVKSTEIFYAGTISAATQQPVQRQEGSVFYDAPENENPANRGLLAMMEYLAEQRYRRPLWKLLEEDQAGIKESSEKVLRLMEDGQKIRYGEAITPPKGNLHHRALLNLGLGRGLEKLTAEELAEFFDKYCPCGRDEHHPDALRRQRRELEELRKEAAGW